MMPTPGHLPPAYRLGLCLLGGTLLLSCSETTRPEAATDSVAEKAAPVGTDPAEKPAPPPVPDDPDATYRIDLDSALQLAAGRNLDLARSVERARLAAAQSDQARLSILPDLNAGANFAKQHGLLQEIGGAPIDTERVSRSAGLGTASGVPGVWLDLSVGSAIFEPLAAQQDRKAAEAAAQAHEHQVLADAAAGYFELVRAHGRLRIAREIESASQKLAQATEDFAQAGEGLEADAQRALATHLLRQGDTADAQAQLRQRSAALARLLHLPVTLTLIPATDSIAATHLVDPDESPGRLVATALRCRPETVAMQAEVAAAAHRFTAQKIQPFLPNLAAGYSNFEFAAGRGSSTERSDARDEVAALIYWKLDGLGLGNQAATRERESELALARLDESRLLDDIAYQVTTLRADLLARRDRLSLGQKAATHARKAYQLTTERLQQSQGLPIEALASIQTLAEARQAEISAVLDYNIAQHRLLAALGHPATK